MMGSYHDGMSWGGWILMAAAMIAFWGLVVFAVVALFRNTRRSNGAISDSRGPLNILEERFARGEIDEDEYHARSAVLRVTSPAARRRT